MLLLLLLLLLQEVAPTHKRQTLCSDLALPLLACSASNLTMASLDRGTGNLLNRGRAASW